MTDNNLKWRYIPKQYGSWFAIYQKFKRLNDKGIWEFLDQELFKRDEPTWHESLLLSLIK